MKDQLITFETAKLAKEKGFNEYCAYYAVEAKGAKDKYECPTYLIQNSNGWITAPTQSLLQKWLREKHNISALISTDPYGSNAWFSKWERLINIEGGTKSASSTWRTKRFKSYEDALEKGLVEALKLIKNVKI